MPSYTQLEIPGILPALPAEKPISCGRQCHKGVGQGLDKEALLAARDLLSRLKSAKRTPRVPGAIRAEAKAILARYPSLEALMEAPMEISDAR